MVHGNVRGVPIHQQCLPKRQCLRLGRFHFSDGTIGNNGRDKVTQLPTSP